MKVEVFFESKYGNGRKVVERFRELMTLKGHQTTVHHIKEVRAKEIGPADLYVFSTPTRIGKPIGSMRRFAKKSALPSGSKYALIATHGAARPDKKTGKMPTAEEMDRYNRTIPVMDEILKGKGGVKAGELKVYVLELKGPLEDGWESKVQAFVEDLSGRM